MALRITLKPQERMIINGALIRNGDRAADILIETQCRMLRGSEIIREEEVDTPCKQLWMTMQVLHLSETPQDFQGLLLSQADELVASMPSSEPYIAAMRKALEEEHTHKAIKEVKRLVQHERELLERGHASSDAA